MEMKNLGWKLDFLKSKWDEGKLQAEELKKKKLLKKDEKNGK